MKIELHNTSLFEDGKLFPLMQQCWVIRSKAESKKHKRRIKQD